MVRMPEFMNKEENGSDTDRQPPESRLQGYYCFLGRETKAPSAVPRNDQIMQWWYCACARQGVRIAPVSLAVSQKTVEVP